MYKFCTSISCKQPGFISQTSTWEALLETESLGKTWEGVEDAFDSLDQGWLGGGCIELVGWWFFGWIGPIGIRAESKRVSFRFFFGGVLDFLHFCSV